MWRRAHDRFRRAVDRYHQMLEPVPASAVRDALDDSGAELAALLDVVRERCVAGQRDAPSAGLDLPPGPASDEHRRISRAATLAAQAAESAAMARLALGSGHDDEASQHADSAARAVASVRRTLG